MFTGIVEELGTVATVDVRPEGAVLEVVAPRLAALAAVGDSIAIDGCCLTVVSVVGDSLRFEATPETLRRSSLGGLVAGRQVNLEDALRAGEPFGGHIVQGHVDGVGTLVELQPDGIGTTLRVDVPGDVLRYAVEKGSLTVAGVSLTVAELHDDGVSIALIPHTCAVTTLGSARVGDTLNLEADVLAKYVERLLPR